MLLAHERAHLTGRHHLFLTATALAAAANPMLRPLRTAVGYTVERWADEAAAERVGNRRSTARAVGKAALASRGLSTGHAAALHVAAAPVPRRVSALLTDPPRGRSLRFRAVLLARRRRRPARAVPGHRHRRTLTTAASHESRNTAATSPTETSETGRETSEVSADTHLTEQASCSW